MSDNEKGAFHGTECASYPNCTGGCGLGCTHDVEASRPATDSERLKLANRMAGYLGPFHFVTAAERDLVVSALRAAAANPIADLVAAAGEYRPSSAEEIAAAEEAFRVAAASAEPVAWQWQSPSGTDWHTMTAHDDPLVREALETQGYRYRPLYTHPAPDAEIVAALEELEKANEALASSRPQAVYDAMIVGRQEDQLLALDRARALARAALAKAKGGSQPARSVPANDCKDPSSCDRHNECMYLGCSVFKGFSK